MEKFRWAFIGSGKLAWTVAKQILPSGRHEIVSVYSRSFENASAFAVRVDGVAYKSIEETVRRENVDGLYICSLNNAHYENALAVINAGKPVLLEKPFTLTAAETETLFKAAEDKGVYLAEAMWTWYGGVSNKVKQWIDDGRIGRIKRIDIDFQLNLFMFKKRVTRLLDKSGGGAIYDLGVYPLTYCYRLLGKPDILTCNSRMLEGVDTRNEITLSYSGGAECKINVAIDKLRPEKAVITGEKGIITVPRFHRANKAVLAADKKETFREKTTYINEFDLVAGEIKAGLKTSCFVPAQATIDVMKMIERCREQ